jgi:hypothetical protein
MVLSQSWYILKNYSSWPHGSDQAQHFEDQVISLIPAGCDTTLCSKGREALAGRAPGQEREFTGPDSCRIQKRFPLDRPYISDKDPSLAMVEFIATGRGHVPLNCCRNIEAR